MIIDHIGIAISDFAKSKEFYSTALAPLGIELIAEVQGWAGFGKNANAEFWFGVGEQAQNPMHVAFSADSREEVDKFYQAAISAGAKDNGRPGIREIYHADYYGAFVIDPDGHNIEAVCHHRQKDRDGMAIQLPKGLTLRNPVLEDHPGIIDVMPAWWGNRDLTHMLPRLFLEHFCATSFIVEDNGVLVAFLVGFLSQDKHDESHIHFIGVHPDYRKLDIGTFLYQRFFETSIENNRSIVRACTSPVNKGSIEFHKRLGFLIQKGNAVVDNAEVTRDYNKAGDHKVLFYKEL